MTASDPITRTKRRWRGKILVVLALALFAPLLAAAPASADPCILYGFCGQAVSYTPPAPTPTRTPTPVAYPTPAPTYNHATNATPVQGPTASGIPVGWEGVWGRLSGPEKQAVIGRTSGQPHSSSVWKEALRKKVTWEKETGQRNAQKRSSHYATGTAITAGGVFSLWLALKVYSPACGPAIAVCAVVL